MPNLAITLRAAILASGKTQYALARESGVAQQAISRFLAKPDATLELENGGKLLAALGFELRQKKPTTRKQLLNSR